MTCADLLAKPLHKSRGHNSITDELNLLVHSSKLSTGCKHIDRFLKGGLPSKRLIEIFGEGSTGKTQFICQLMINSVLPADHGGLGGKALAIFTGKPLSEKRFTDIKDHIVQQNPDIITSDDIDRNIKLLQASDMEIFNDIMNDIETKVGKENIRCIIIDNLATLCEDFINKEAGVTEVDYIQRAIFLTNLASTLKGIAYRKNMVIITVNNVTADISLDASEDDPSKVFTEKPRARTNYKPCLGPTWTTLVNDRICLQKVQMGPSSYKRRLVVDQSSHWKHTGTNFTITDAGIQGDEF
ncbi:unnamed protein product [Moneuplotes crassus]|uniref:RecA family profile 1 domain-containing protein n=1 Tax=Euplotes crassus TaxID=5936 RepID=A0AAD1XKI4_EUPCR|nr:unnamed protein product [Moneuplotes crassus]